SKDPIFGKIINFLKERKNLDITITGYADSIGTVQNNLRLAERRCASVRQILINAGLDQTRIQDTNFKSIPKGENEQIKLAEQPDLARALSRRVVISIVPRKEDSE
ncbi:MAG: OmpA family protein, partial [Bacteroidota bacterium]